MTVSNKQLGLWSRIGSFYFLLEGIGERLSGWIKTEIIQKAYIYNIPSEPDLNLRQRNTSRRIGNRAQGNLGHKV